MGVVALALAQFVAAPAQAQRFRAVTVLGIAGPGGDQFASSLEEALGDRYAIIDRAFYRARAEELNARGASPAEVVKVCRKLRIDAVLAGALRRGPDGIPYLHLVVRDGGTGEVLGRIDERLRNGALDRRGWRRFVQASEDLVERAVGVRRPSSVPQENLSELEGSEDDETPGASATPSEEPAREEGPVVRKAAPPKEAALPPLELDVGYAVLARFLDIDAPGAAAYHSAAISTIRIDAGVFPFAWAPGVAQAHPVLAMFGGELSVLTAMPFSSTTALGDVIPSHALRWDASLVARIPLGAGGAFALRAASGYGEFVFTSDQPDLLHVPDVHYKYLREAVGVIVPLGTPKLALDGGAAFLGIVDGGAITSSTEYGGGGGWGLQADVGVTYRPLDWLYLRAVGHYALMSLGFNGGGARLGNGSRDQVVDGGIVVGYAAR